MFLKLLKRRFNPLKTHKSPCGILINFTGVSGVGKSTFYNDILEKERFWMTPNEFMSINNIKFTPAAIEESEVYDKLSQSKIDRIYHNPYKAIDKFRSFYWNYQALVNDALIHKHNQHSIVISDEGILHTFPKEIQSIVQSECHDMITTFFKGRALIYCYASPQTIAKQIIDRYNSTGRIIAHHKDKNEDELISDLTKWLDDKEEYLKILKQFHIPILKINTQDSTELNSEKVKHFTKTLINKESSLN